MMSEKYKPNTSFQTRQRFEFLCPKERSTEARFLGEHAGVRLLPPNPNARETHLVDIRTRKSHLAIPIRGVAKTKEKLTEIVHVLAESSIAAFNFGTQVQIQPTYRSAGEIKKSRESESRISFKDGALQATHQWNSNTVIDADTYASQLDETFKDTITFLHRIDQELHGVLRGLLEKNPHQFRRLVSGLQEIGNNSNEAREQQGIADLVSKMEQVYKEVQPFRGNLTWTESVIYKNPDWNEGLNGSMGFLKT